MNKQSRLYQLFFASITQKILGLFFVIVLIAILANLASYGYFRFILKEDHAFLHLQTGLILTFVSVALIGFLFIYLEKTFVRPIRLLEQQAHALESMDYTNRVRIDTGDEFQNINEILNNTMDLLEFVKDEHNQLEKTKTEFFSITSHELRSPMTPMRAQLEMLKLGYFGRLNKKQLESVEIVYRNTTRLDKIVADLLEVSRIEGGRLKFNFVKANLAVHIQHVFIEMKGFMPEKKITFVKKISKLPVIVVDPDRVMQVLRNLINNAIKFSNDRGKIVVSAKVIGKFIQFSVQDEGIGIPVGEQGNLFTPFYQVDKHWNRKVEGNGLGLAICKGIVESQKGKIWLESTAGKGSTFYFTVPLKPYRAEKSIVELFVKPDARVVAPKN